MQSKKSTVECRSASGCTVNVFRFGLVEIAGRLSKMFFTVVPSNISNVLLLLPLLLLEELPGLLFSLLLSNECFGVVRLL